MHEQAIREAWVREAFFAVHRVGDPVEPIFAEVQADFPNRCQVVKRGELNHHAFLGRNDSILAIEERDGLLVDVWVAKFGRVLKGFDAGCPIRDLSP